MDLTIVAPNLSFEASASLERSGVTLERADTSSRARGEFTLVAGAGEVPLGLLEALWAKRGEAEAVVASRHVRGARGGSLADRWVNRAVRRALDLPCFDATSSVHLYRTSALRRAGALDASSGLERLVRLVNAGFKIREVPHTGPPVSGGLRGQLLALFRLRRLRLSPDAADRDDRVFERAHRFRRRKLEERLATIVGFLEVDVPVLDLGCGSGRLIQTRAKGVGLDRDPAKIRFLRDRAKAAVCGDNAKIPFRDGSFPQLVLAGVPFDDGHVAELERVLTSRGTLVVAAPATASAEIDERLAKASFVVEESRRVGSERILRAVLRRKKGSDPDPSPQEI